MFLKASIYVAWGGDLHSACFPCQSHLLLFLCPFSLYVVGKSTLHLPYSSPQALASETVEDSLLNPNDYCLKCNVEKERIQI